LLIKDRRNLQLTLKRKNSAQASTRGVAHGQLDQFRLAQSAGDRAREHRPVRKRPSVVIPVLALHVPYGVKVGVLKRLGRREPLLMVVSQQSVEEADGFGVGKVLIFRSDELLPGRARVTAKDGVEFAVEPHAIFVEIPDAGGYAMQRVGSSG
jgi:hypothetical protein